MVWMSQNQLAELFATSVPNISMHISNILEEKELDEISVSPQKVWAIRFRMMFANDGILYCCVIRSLIY
jgi:hypothetical protein